MGGPAMVEGGGLGVFAPEAIGPMDVQVPNGVVDVLVPDEAAAVATAKQYPSYFSGPVDDWPAPDQALLRDVIPQNPLRVSDVYRAIDGLADTGSALGLRSPFGVGLCTALLSRQGRPMGVHA